MNSRCQHLLLALLALAAGASGARQLTQVTAVSLFGGMQQGSAW